LKGGFKMREISNRLLNEGGGILRLAPAWVPRTFCRPGRRIKLHPDDYYVLGLNRGGIDERWLSSTTPALNGPLTGQDEGMSFAVGKNSERAMLAEIMEELKDEMVGGKLLEKYGKWPMYAKFFDNLGPLPHHVHHDNEKAAKVGHWGKPEMYFFPSQMNNHGGEFPFTFFGFNPETTKDQVRQCLADFSKGDNNILDLSRAYKLTLDTGWNVPAGILHAPGSLCTYEPQLASDVMSMWQSVLYHGHTVDEELVWQYVPEENKGDLDYLLGIADWEKNIDPNFRQNYFMAPRLVSNADELERGFIKKEICYLSDIIGAMSVSVEPGCEATLSFDGPFGVIAMEGYGKFGAWDMETPTLIRYGELTNDEFFVSAKAAKEGVSIKNNSSALPLTFLMHYAK
jgi:hypothetical protein